MLSTRVHAGLDQFRAYTAGVAGPAANAVKLKLLDVTLCRPRSLVALVITDWLHNRYARQRALQAPRQIRLDLDATDDLLHRNEEEWFFYGDSGHDRELPLHIFWGEDLLCARLRPSTIDAAKGSVEELPPIVT